MKGSPIWELSGVQMLRIPVAVLHAAIEQIAKAWHGKEFVRLFALNCHKLRRDENGSGFFFVWKVLDTLFGSLLVFQWRNYSFQAPTRKDSPKRTGDTTAFGWSEYGL